MASSTHQELDRIPLSRFTGWRQPSKNTTHRQPFIYVCGHEAEPELDHGKLRVVGCLLLIFAVAVMVLSTYALVVSKLLPPTGVSLLDWIREDTYYCVLVLMMIPVSLLKVYTSWLSMSFFKHA